MNRRDFLKTVVASVGAAIGTSVPVRAPVPQGVTPAIPWRGVDMLTQRIIDDYRNRSLIHLDRAILTGYIGDV